MWRCTKIDKYQVWQSVRPKRYNLIQEIIQEHIAQYGFIDELRTDKYLEIISLVQECEGCKKSSNLIFHV